MRISASNVRLGHDRAAVLAVRRKAIACDEGSDLVRGQLLVAEFIAGPEHDLYRVLCTQCGDGSIRLIGIASFAGDVHEEHRLPGEAGKINAAPGQRRLVLVVVQLHCVACKASGRRYKWPRRHSAVNTTPQHTWTLQICPRVSVKISTEDQRWYFCAKRPGPGTWYLKST